MIHFSFDYGPADPGCVYDVQQAVPNTVPPQVCEDQASLYATAASILIAATVLVLVGVYIYRKKAARKRK